MRGKSGKKGLKNGRRRNKEGGKKQHRSWIDNASRRAIEVREGVALKIWEVLQVECNWYDEQKKKRDREKGPIGNRRVKQLNIQTNAPDRIKDPPGFVNYIRSTVQF